MTTDDPAGGPRQARGDGSVFIGGDNYGSITTDITHHVKQWHVFGRRPRTSVTDMSDRLAGYVQKQWSDEVAHLNLSGQRRLPMTWTPAPVGLCASVKASREWTAQHDRAALVSRGEQWAVSGAALAGAGGPALADVWLTRTPGRQLVVLGEAGSGKSELMIETLISVLARRAEFGGAVPVLVPVAAWDFGEIVDWLERWLVQNYPFLSRRAPGDGTGSYARALLAANRIAVILDGFDELPQTNRKQFLDRLDHDVTTHPQRMLMLTSRVEEFAGIVLSPEPAPLGAAPGVKLDRQDREAVIGYLTATHLPAARWNRVAASIRQGGPLAGVLETPLMAMLADTVYNAAADPRPDPGRLLLYTSTVDLEQHLLDSYVEERMRGQGHWEADDVGRWLGFAASTLNTRTNSTDLTWWDLRPAGHGHRLWTYGALLVAAIFWTAVSATTFNGWIFQDLGLGLAAGARVTAAVTVGFVAVVALTRNVRAGLLAALGAYIAGTVSAGYDLAIGAAIAGGFAWRPLTVSRCRWWHVMLFAGVTATVATLLQDDQPSANSKTGEPWTQGFGAGFADGWASRGDEVVNGWLLTAVVTGVLLWSVVRSEAPTAAGRLGPAGYGLAVGLLVAALDSLTNGVRADVTDGRLIGPADGWAAGLAVWCAATWISGHRSRSPRRTAVLLALATAGVHAAGYSARTDMPYPWLRALAEGIGVAVAVWFVLHPGRHAPVGRRAGTFGIWVWAVVVAAVTGVLDGLSAGWTRGAITGLSIGLITATARYVLRRRAAPPSLFVSPLDAGLFAVVVVGIAAGFAYGLMFGIVFGLAVQVSRDVSRRRFPSHKTRLTWLGSVGGTILGTVVAVAAGFSGIPLGWLIPIGLTTGAVAAIAFGTRGEAVPDDVVTSPRRLLRRDRRTFAVAVVIIAVSLGLAAGVRTVAQGGNGSVGVVAVLSSTFTYGVTAGLLIAVAQSRYGAYTLWRFVFAMRGRLPWRLMTFLTTLHRRGILRRNGAVYQFRHQFLQDRLVAKDTT